MGRRKKVIENQLGLFDVQKNEESKKAKKTKKSTKCTTALNLDKCQDFYVEVTDESSKNKKKFFVWVPAETKDKALDYMEKDYKNLDYSFRFL